MVCDVLHPVLEVVAGLAGAGTARAARGAAVRVDELVDLRVAVVLGWNHGYGQFALRAIALLHDLADAQTTVLSRDVRLLAICCGLDRCECRWWLMLKRQVVKSGELHAVVEVLRAKAR